MLVRTCRVCGCTDRRACLDEGYRPCWWVEADLCSACVDDAVAIYSEAEANAFIREWREGR